MQYPATEGVALAGEKEQKSKVRSILGLHHVCHAQKRWGINIYSWWRNLLPFLLQLTVFWSKLLQKPKSLPLIRIVLSIMSCTLISSYTRSYACLPFQGFMHEVNILVCLSVCGGRDFEHRLLSNIIYVWQLGLGIYLFGKGPIVVLATALLHGLASKSHIG